MSEQTTEADHICGCGRTDCGACLANRVAELRACAWADYRKDYGIHPSDMTVARKAFAAGWQAALGGDQTGPLR